MNEIAKLNSFYGNTLAVQAWAAFSFVWNFIVFLNGRSMKHYCLYTVDHY